MRKTGAFFLIVFLLFMKVGFGQKENNFALEKLVSLEVKDEAIEQVLDKISQQAHVFFSYDASLFVQEKKVSRIFLGITIKEVLDQLFEKKYDYREFVDQIIVTKAEPDPLTIDTTLVIPEKPSMILLQGRILDRDEKDALPFSVVSVQKINVSTLSNSDGDFELKIPEVTIDDTITFSCMGYKQSRYPIREIMGKTAVIFMQPSTIHLKEIKVSVVNPAEILEQMVRKINTNYPLEIEVMTTFYREVLKQDNNFIDVAEAVMELRKTSYLNESAQDKMKFLKGRKSMNVEPFKYVDFKIQGGPYYITKLDVVKTLDTFLDPAYREDYKYTIDKIVEVNERKTYIINFRPRPGIDYPCYQGKIYIDLLSFAMVRAEFELNRTGLKFAHESLIKKKPKDFYVRPVQVKYQVNYSLSGVRWHLGYARAYINFRVKSKKDKINSLFQSTSELLVTDVKPNDGIRLKKNELFSMKDIFTDIISDYDEEFWGTYNTIKPSEDLRKALQKNSDENNSTLKEHQEENSH